MTGPARRRSAAPGDRWAPPHRGRTIEQLSLVTSPSAHHDKRCPSLSWSAPQTLSYARLMTEHARHLPLRPIPWTEREVAAAIEDVVFDADQFWPAHPLDEGIRDGHTSLYFGAAGVTSTTLAA